MNDDIMNEAPYLVYEFERRAYPLSDAAFTIGRDASSNIVVREPTVSRSHAEVRADGDGYFVHAVGATVTRHNGAPVTTPIKLTDGDRIEVGSAEFTFRRGRLPLGVSIVDIASPAGHDPDVMTKRDTIKSPILGGSKSSAPKEKSAAGTLILVGLLIAAVAYYFFMR
ncbi:MAG: FHA domain-containing protein [Gemmatimonadales bacterium]